MTVVNLAPAGVRGIHAFLASAMLYLAPLNLAESSLQFCVFDASYVSNLCAGNPQTQAHFFAYFSELLRIKLRGRLQSPQAIEDVCQETFTRVFSVLRKNGLRHPERLGAFVNMVCNHVLSEHYRSSNGSESLDVERRSEVPDNAASALDLVAAKQMREKVRTILKGLPARDSSLLQAVFLDERDRDEVCREFGVDRDYLRVLLHRAKQEFKTEFVKRMVKLPPLGAN